MSDDIIEIKPGFLGLKLNVRAAIRRLATPKQADPVAIVASRFLQLFRDHSVPVSQIPRLVPQLTLDKLRTTEALLPALTGEVIDHVASLFRVERPWIEGATESMYDCLWCYKKPENFFEDLAATNIEGVFQPIRALFSTRTLDMHKPRPQPLALLLVEKIADLGDEEVVRYRIYRDDWDWGYWKCRIQLKAIARVVDMELSERIPLFFTDEKLLENVRAGCCVPPTSMMRHASEDFSLEDFALGSDESACSKESGELPLVLEYIENTNLEKVARHHLRGRDMKGE